MKPAGDHEMNNEKEFAFQLENDAFAEPAKCHDFLSFRSADRRIKGSQNKRAADADFQNRLI